MERILVFSDTHGDIDYAIKAFDTILGVSAVIHLGDCVRDAQRIENYIYPVPIYFVSGNNDFCSPYPREQIIEISDKRLFLCHGHFHRMDDLKEIALENDIDIVLFGHTHIPYYEKENGVIYANPGSISRPRVKDRCYGVIEIDDEYIGYSNIFI